MARSQLQEAVSSNFIDGIERRISPRADFVVRVNYQTVDSLNLFLNIPYDNFIVCIRLVLFQIIKGTFYNP